MSGWFSRLRASLGRIGVRLLVVNLLVVIVPIAGVEFADVYEKQLLGALERDMRDQAIIVRRFLEADLRDGTALGASRHEIALRRAAAQTRTRVRVFDRQRELVADSHREGPPEGPEPPAPTFLGSASGWSSDVLGTYGGPAWPEPRARQEVEHAFQGQPSSYTRVRGRNPGVLLFITEPIMPRRRVEGVVYVVRSTRPVLAELHRVRQGLYLLAGLALLFTLGVTLALAFSISRPLGRLSRAAKRIARGERGVGVPVEGSGEIRELGESFASMTSELSRRLRFASEFAADVAHEFKSPLTGIRGAAELLNDGAAEDPKARERFLSNILLDVHRLDRLVSRLLELGRVEASTTEGPIENIALQTVVQELAERHPGLNLVTTSVTVRGRSADMRRAIKNLIENATRFSPDEHSVDVTVRAERGRAKVVVDDRGPGIPADELERIFERFYTTDEDREGTGLGLAIVRAVAEAHGGSVHAEHRPGGGARFVLDLPAVS